MSDLVSHELHPVRIGTHVLATDGAALIVKDRSRALQSRVTRFEVTDFQLEMLDSLRNQRGRIAGSAPMATSCS